MDKIGLFPLQIVLFPESVFPLHIFEEKYKKLINKCISTKAFFGINLSVATKMYNVGCTAQILDIVKKDENGNLDITVRGVKRYKLDTFDEGEHNYLIADIDYFGDEDDELDVNLLDKAIIEFNKIAEIVDSIKIEKLARFEISSYYPSFLLAQKAGLTLGQRQELLEMTNENKRLRYLLDHIKKIQPMLQEAEFVQKIIKNDGYLQPQL